MRRICILFLAATSSISARSFDLQDQKSILACESRQQAPANNAANIKMRCIPGSASRLGAHVFYGCLDGYNFSQDLFQIITQPILKRRLQEPNISSAVRALPENSTDVISNKYFADAVELPLLLSPYNISSTRALTSKKQMMSGFFHFLGRSIVIWHIAVWPFLLRDNVGHFYIPAVKFSLLWFFIAACALLLIPTLLVLTRRPMHWRRKSNQGPVRRFDRLLAEVTSRLADNPLGHTLEEIRGGLDRLCTYLGVERVSFFVRKENGDHFNLLCSSLLSGPDPLLPAFDEEENSWIITRLREQYPILIEDIDQLPHEASTEIGLFKQNSVKSFAAVPITSGYSVAGFLALTTTQHQRDWPEMIIQQVQILGNVLYQAYVREEMTGKAFDVEQKFTLAVERSPVMVWMAGTDKLCTYFNQGWLDFTGRSFRQEIGNGWAEGVHPEDVDHCIAEYHKAFDARQKFELEYRLRRSDGEYRWIIHYGTPRYGITGNFNGYIGSCTDVTELKRSEQDLKNLSSRLIHAQEEERKRIARDLHDDFGQQLTLLALDLEKLNAHSCQGPAIGQAVHSLEARIKDLSRAMNERAHQLHSSHLEILGLTPAIQAFCGDFSKQHGIYVDFSHGNFSFFVPSDISLCLFRVLQEAMQNIAKHSHAKNCRVELKAEPNDIVLRIWDSGVGFDTGRLRSNAGLGLISMRERLRLVDGEIRVDSAHAKGTQLEIRVPLRKLPASA